MIKTIVICIFSILIPDAYGDELGNGGDAVVSRLRTGPIVRAQLLDFWEHFQYPLAFDQATLDPVQKALQAIERIKEWDPRRYESYKRDIENFLANTEFVSDRVLPDISDHGGIPICAACTIEQVAIQKVPDRPRQKYFTINELIWNVLDTDNQAGLILHEVIYKDALLNGHKNSKDARYFTAVMSSKFFEDEQYGESEYRHFLETEVNLPVIQ